MRRPHPDGIEDDAEFEARRIYVLSPQGKVVELPSGATAVDFAYAIHTSVGHRCRGAKVDGQIQPLAQPLESGQKVEILTAKEGGPSRDWLNPHSGYLTTKRARNRVRQWFKQQDYDQHLSIGRASLDREVARLSVAKPDLDKLARASISRPVTICWLRSGAASYRRSRSPMRRSSGHRDAGARRPRNPGEDPAPDAVEVCRRCRSGRR